jgi:hypothetical protein
MLDKIAQRVIDKYPNSSCQQLAEGKSHPPTVQRAQTKQQSVDTPRKDLGTRAESLDRVAAPIAIGRFECGTIP